VKAPRGSLVSIFDHAARIAEARLAGISQYLDDIATPSEPSSGGTLSRAAFRDLLAGNERFQEHLAERAVFMTPQEKASLKREIERVAPPQDTLPASVTGEEAL